VNIPDTTIHLSYCTNIHPAETWIETWNALKNHTLKVRDLLRAQAVTGEHPKLRENQAYGIGLRLSAKAAQEIKQGDRLQGFKKWLEQENCYVYTINGFPYGAFHGERVKEKVYQPDWTTEKRMAYTKDMFDIIAELCPIQSGGSVSTLPGSFKEFQADESLVFKNLETIALYIEQLSNKSGKDLHLGLEPEPLGHFENTEETITFFERLLLSAKPSNRETLRRRIGLNFDTCHFALEFDDCADSLSTFKKAGIRISKIHLSNAIEINPNDQLALEAIRSFDEPTYLHQFMVMCANNKVLRYKDIPDFFSRSLTDTIGRDSSDCMLKARIHFHIPLYSTPSSPLESTSEEALKTIRYLKDNPDCCSHVEMETYTWGVLPNELQIPVEEQLLKEHLWTLDKFSK